MKKANHIVKSFILATIVMVFFTINTRAQVQMNPDSVTMGAGYANEVYYSFQNGTKEEVARDTWDIAFRTMILSSSIITNDGAGVVLWTYPNADTSGWNTLDTNGISSWIPMYNDPSDWENGAFSRYATGHPDYGWGIYNMATHIITGDSLYVIQLTDGSFKKLWIVEKDSPLNVYLIRYANLDGTDFQEMAIDCNLFLNKEFVGLNMQINLPVDYQPAKDSWDVVFTKYMSVQPNGTPYPVTGVLNNPEVYAKKYYPVNPDYNEWGVLPWDSSRSAIGWDWKVFDMNQMVYVVEDSMVFFVRDLAGDVYRLVFTGFAGMSTGKICFGTKMVSAAGISDYNKPGFYINLYPNPAEDRISVMIQSETTLRNPLHYELQDLTGKVVLKGVVQDPNASDQLNLSSLGSGIYLMRMTSGEQISVTKLIKR